MNALLTSIRSEEILQIFWIRFSVKIASSRSYIVPLTDMAKQPTVRLLLHWNNAVNLKLELMNLLLLMPAMIERSQALNRMIYLRFSNVKSTHPIEEDIGIKILKMTTKVSFLTWRA